MIEKMFVVSTAHLPTEVGMAINDGIFFHKPTMAREEGWLFNIPYVLATEPKEGTSDYTSKAFIAVMKAGLNRDCSWVLFDRDADETPELPTFDW